MKNIDVKGKNGKKNVNDNGKLKGNKGEQTAIVLETEIGTANGVGMIVADHAVETDDDTNTECSIPNHIVFHLLQNVWSVVNSFKLI